MDDNTKKPEPRPSLATMQALGLAAALGASTPAKKKLPGHYAEAFCRVCKADAGTPLPCGFCPKPVVEKPTGETL